MLTRLKRLVLSAASAVTLASPALAQGEPPRTEMAIDNLSFRGDGCRPGSVSSNLAPDGKAFTLLFDSFIVEASQAVPKAAKMCEIDVKMKVPSGWSFAVVGVDVRGYAALNNDKSKGNVRSLYAFAKSQNPTLLAEESFKGPLSRDYQLTSEADAEALVFSPCGAKRMLSLRTRLAAQVNPGARNLDGGALLTVDSVDAEVRQKYAIVWQKCPGGRNDPANETEVPNLGQSFTGACEAQARNVRTNTIVGLYQGAGVGFSAQAAKRAAQSDAMRRCRKDRQASGNAGVTCTVDATQCTTIAD